MLPLGLVLALICSAQEAPTFRSDVALVRVDAEVTDGIKTLNGFRKEDFIVKDKGQPQQVLYFSQEQVPLDYRSCCSISAAACAPTWNAWRRPLTPRWPNCIRAIGLPS